MRRLKENHRASFGQQVFKSLAPLTGFARQKPIEREPVGRQAANRQRRQHGRCTRNHTDLDATLNRRTHQDETWVTNRWHAGIANHQHVGGFGQIKDLLDAFCLVVLVQAKKFGGQLDA